MAKLKPWYSVVTPREDLRENHALDASEFAVHLDHVRDHRAHADYVKPDRFFDRTYLTKSLLDLSSQVVRRLSGEKLETSAVFNMATQFGGGKTHALTALYHLADGGDKAKNWRDVSRILSQAGVSDVPHAAVAVFVGTEFDVIEGRSGDDEPIRLTPWGEIAWQLGGAEAFAAVAKHDEQRTAPGGDVIRKMLPDGPALILIDELLNYVSRGRKSGASQQMYNFLNNLCEEARARDSLVVCVSIPASELEMTADDQADYERYKKMLNRLGKAIAMASDQESAEIIRRRLFEWGGLSTEARATIAAYSEWAREHAPEIAGLGGDSPSDLFAASYPFHPAVLSAFQRKWQSLPGFQRTRGVLRLLALWVSYAYSADHQKAVSSPLIELGSAPLQDPVFRAAVLQELGQDRLTVPVETDIAGKADAHAVVLDAGATDSIKKARLHQKVATTIFFESTGGMSPDKSEAAISEIKAAIGGPDVNLAELDTVLEGLVQSCFYLRADKHRYRYSLRPNLNQVLVSRRGAVSDKDVDERVRKTTADVFQKISLEGPKTVDRRFFPVQTNDVPDKPQLAIVVVDADSTADNPKTKPLIEDILRNCGSSARVFKSALFFAASDGAESARDAVREALAWEDIAEDEDTLSQLEEHDVSSLKVSGQRARQNATEAVWRMYRHVYLLGRDGGLQHLDLGQITSSMASSLTELVVNHLVQVDEVTPNVSAKRLVQSWQGVTPEWSTKAARDAFYSSPKLPRPLDPEFIKWTIASGVSSGELGYARKEGDHFVLDRFGEAGEAMSEFEVEVADDVFIFRKEDAQKLLEPPRAETLRISPSSVQLAPGAEAIFTIECFDQYGKSFQVENVEWSSPEGVIDGAGRLEVDDFEGVFVVKARHGDLEAQVEISVTTAPPPPPPPPAGDRFVHWEGDMPPQKWSQFYMKVLAGFATDEDLKLHVTFWAPATAEQAEAKLNEIRAALRDLGLDDDATLAE